MLSLITQATYHGKINLISWSTSNTNS